MAHRFTKRSFYLAMLLLAATALPAMAGSGKELFEQQCAGCHTIGGGDGAGPDLKGVGEKRQADWLVRVIAEPDKLTAEKDPTQLELVKKYGSEMPNLGVSRDDAQSIATFLKGGAEAAGGAAAAEAPQQEVVVTPELLAKGTALFTGKTQFEKGGPPCVACHAMRYPGVHAGALASDLTGMYGKMGENGVRGVLKGLSFPVMKKAYADRPLSDDEKTALTALFKDASQKQEPKGEPYPLIGLGFFAILIIAAILYKRRIS